MARKQRPHRIDAGDRADFEAAGAEMRFHQAAHRLPVGLGNAAVKAAVRDNFDIAIRELDVNQHAVVVFGVPHPQTS